MRDWTEEQLEANLHAFMQGEGSVAGLLPDARYASFDYCYNHFQGFRDSGNIAVLASDEHLQMSALHLGFYLASWGMYRGSADLLQRSVRHLVPVVRLVSKTPEVLWAIDIDGYGDSEITELLRWRELITAALNGKATDTLVTKIMLGVFGNVPAFDRQFKDGFGVSTLGRKSLRAIRDFATVHAAFLERQTIFTHNFLTGEHTDRRYPKAKLLDMIFFMEGSSARAVSTGEG